MQADVIDHLELSPPIDESVEEPKRRESRVDEILYFNEGVRVYETGVSFFGENTGEVEVLSPWATEQHQNAPPPGPPPSVTAGGRGTKLNIAELFGGDLNSFL
jgi:hypothetical protein